jgi:RNA polymerase sigma-70 factor (ECF subfamily)
VDAVDFGTLYGRHAEDVLRFAFYLCGNRAVAEDITSETFVRAWVARDEIRVGSVRVYLFTIARNLCRTWRRDEGRAVAVERDVPDQRREPQAEEEARA